MVCSLGGIKIHLLVVLDASYVYSDKFSMLEIFRFDFSFLALLMAHPCFDSCLVKGEIWLELSSFFSLFSTCVSDRVGRCKEVQLYTYLIHRTRNPIINMRVVKAVCLSAIIVQSSAY